MVATDFAALRLVSGWAMPRVTTVNADVVTSDVTGAGGGGAVVLLLLLRRGDA